MNFSAITACGRSANITRLIRTCFGRLTALDYVYAPYRAEEMHWFCKPSPHHRTHHLHLVPVASHRYRAELVFRDRLRTRPEIAEDYLTLKRDLSTKFEHDREAYTAAKTDFVRACVDSALADLGLKE